MRMPSVYRDAADSPGGAGDLVACQFGGGAGDLVACQFGEVSGILF
jgi:hypothetical protein